MHLWIQCTVIQGSRDQHAFDHSPGLIAVFHALHRLLAPRHPPHALSSLAALTPSWPALTPISSRQFPSHSADVAFQSLRSKRSIGPASAEVTFLFHSNDLRVRMGPRGLDPRKSPGVAGLIPGLRISMPTTSANRNNLRLL
jgi:hypothetical protein